MRAILFCAVVAVGLPQGPAQSYTPPDQISYFSPFLDRPPSELELASLPAGGREVIVAKVRLLMRPAWIFNPDMPRSLGYAFYVRVRVVEAARGSAQAGDEHEVFFGAIGSDKEYKFPRTRAQIERSYFMVSFIGPDGLRALLPFSIERREFEEWKGEFYRDYRIGE
jgi:hypothetical protein